MLQKANCWSADAAPLPHDKAECNGTAPGQSRLVLQFVGVLEDEEVRMEVPAGRGNHIAQAHVDGQSAAWADHSEIGAETLRHFLLEVCGIVAD